MNICLIPVRFDSNRLPGKALLRIDGKKLIDYVIEGALKSCQIDRVGIITTNRNEDIKLIEPYKENESIFCYSWDGHWNDVLGRFNAAIDFIEKDEKIEIDNVIRLTVDCPLLYYFSDLIDAIIEFHINENLDFTYNTHFRNAWPSGLDVEVINRNVLREINGFANYEEREHVTLYIKNNSKKYDIGYVKTKNQFEQKWSIDTAEDFEKISDLIKILNNSMKGATYEVSRRPLDK